MMLYYVRSFTLYYVWSFISVSVCVYVMGVCVPRFTILRDL